MGIAARRMPIAAGAEVGTGPIALSLIARAAVVLVVTVLAYHYTLGTLWRGFGDLTPFAYGILVPPLALLVAMVHGLERLFEPNIHDRSLDYMIGGALLAAALGIVLILPLPLSVFFWHWRIDVLSVPLFVAAAICITFDVRALWRMRFAVVLMFLAWPPPYFFLAPAATAVVTSASAAVVHAIWPLLVAWHLVDIADLQVLAAGPSIQALLAFLVVTIAAAFLSRGRALAKMAWIATGLVVAWVLDLAEQFFISFATAGSGTHPSAWLTSPYAGLLSLGVALAFMVALMPPYGLGPRTTYGVRRVDAIRSLGRLGVATVMVCIAGLLLEVSDSSPTLSPSSYVGAITVGVALLGLVVVLLIHGLGPKTLEGVRRVAVRRSASRLLTALALVGGAGLLVGEGDAQLHQYERVADVLGSTLIPADTVASFKLSGWNSKTESHRWAAISLDKSATWTRYTYQPTAAGSSAALTLDVISTTDLNLFSTYGIESSYRLQNHPLLASEWVDLGDGVSGHAVRYALDEAGATWTGVYWQWPVQAASGVRYERVVLSARETLTARGPPVASEVDAVRQAQLDVANGVTSLEGRGRDWSAPPQREFMVGVAREIVAAAVAKALPGSNP